MSIRRFGIYLAIIGALVGAVGAASVIQARQLDSTRNTGTPSTAIIGIALLLIGLGVALSARKPA